LSFGISKGERIMTDRIAAQPVTGRAGADLTPSQQKILDIMNKYRGRGPDKGKMISSVDVHAAIGALDERHGPDIPGRSELAVFLEGSNGDIDPDRFLPADAAALKAAILKGIDSPAALEGQPKPVQAAVLQNLPIQDSQATEPWELSQVGFSVQHWDGVDFSGVTDANVRNALQDAVGELKPPKGYGPQPGRSLSSVNEIDLDSQPYGYQVTAGYWGPPSNKPDAGDMTWVTTILANAGQIVHKASVKSAYRPAPSPGRPAVELTRSEQEILDIIDKYRDYDPKTMISSADVQAAIGALDERHALDAPGRSELVIFLDEFGGGEPGKPDQFLPADKAALKAAIMKGIDSPTALEDLPKRVQAAVLGYLGLSIDSCTGRSPVGFSVQQWDGLDFSRITDANARNALRGWVNKLKPPAGYGPQPDDSWFSGVKQSDLNGQPYGYSVTASYWGPPSNEPDAGDMVWEADLLANASGQIVSEGSFRYAYSD
jgi:hypothetical protein